MALNLQTIKNNKGQALTETIFLMGMTGVFLYFLLRCLLTVIFTVALDSMAEDYFFCHLADRTGCLKRLEVRLKDNQMQNIKIQVEHRSRKTILKISGLHLTQVNITREFDYEKFKKKF
jgi:hypothetical protein